MLYAINLPALHGKKGSSRSLLQGGGQLLKVFVIGKVKELPAKGHELCKGTGIGISEIGNHYRMAL